MLQRYQMSGIPVHPLHGYVFQLIQWDSFILYRNVPSNHFNASLEQASSIPLLATSVRGRRHARLDSSFCC